MEEDLQRNQTKSKKKPHEKVQESEKNLGLEIKNIL